MKEGSQGRAGEWRAQVTTIGPPEAQVTTIDDLGHHEQRLQRRQPDPQPLQLRGRKISPPLAWTGTPARTEAFALIVDDPDSGVVHWVVFDLPGDSTALAEGASGTTAGREAKRSTSAETDWTGPRPPSGTHHYQFRPMALDAPTGLVGTPTVDEIRQAIEGHIIEAATLTGTYRRVH